MSTPLKVWQRWSTPTKATNPDSNGSSHGTGLDMVTPVSGRVSEIQFDDPRILPEKISELEKEVCDLFFTFVFLFPLITLSLVN
jgi:hypothetical protein